MKILSTLIYENVIPKKYLADTIFFKEEEFEKLEETLGDITILITLPGFINKKLLDCLPNLKWVQITAAGYDHADIEELKKRKLPVTNTSGVMSISIAEDIFCKILFLARNVREFELAKEKKEWASFGQHPWMCSIHTDLYGKTVGILGDGPIPREFATRAKAFGMKALAYGRTQKELACFDQHLTGAEGLDYLAKNSDFIVIAIPYNESTHHLVNEAFLSRMKKSAYLINIARGSIIEENDLIVVLENKQIAGAALDVFEIEPLQKDSPLWELSNVYLTSHKAGAGDSWIQFLSELIAFNISAFEDEKPMKNQVLGEMKL